MRAVVLLSGGMDSLVTTAIAAHLGYELAALHINYGQRTEKRELVAFQKICDFYRIERRLEINFEHLSLIGGSSLTDLAMPVTTAKLHSKEIPTSYVAFRNANMLSVAVSWAEVIGANKIFIGAVDEDSSGYPDCRVNFFQAFNELIKHGTKPDTRIEIQTPVISLKKWEIVIKGMELEVPFEHSWSCYKSEHVACGVCDSCALRLRAFEQAGIRDPIEYKIRPSYI
ncbi:exsB protein [Chloroherpeton thalassium ATCC 35110]|uniref:7-cyano-7-deazaguanine synthase n=1 Tax=Chloroherpeton thalassium (strain ATCC 35110 / GB-78) TaxID=517418 RepID=QUEC_CHLT3|nr:7-cyano-7-deazaguanine synthase QueC [Chloroherpeton thalassium]B3QS09.1 RecName: Full=7-cyano-7-deazaguanine synthase; AltName: Full=7-cyano-7-carbaguanine synthase; AltName: Full=PreQ(0) synthase; AltName: Full=Queuosine biosynthesis protein QueC [Chloroherpeton thalassium ATCC 35110]ACF13954.1 exsB protein [Chloroherpeton thalassium ATCC 35110]